MRSLLLAAAVLFPPPAGAEPPIPDPDGSIVELSSAVARARALGRGMRERRSRRVSLRFPTLELAAVRSQGVLGGTEVALSSAELTSARTVFGDSIDYGAVRIVFVPAVFGSAVQVWGDTIRVPFSARLSRAGLIHELAHVWQYQTGGTGYISDAVVQHAASLFETGSTDKSYEYAVTTGSRLVDFTAEQQAEIAEDYFRKPEHRADPNYRSLVAEFKAARASRDRGRRSALWEEHAAGLPPRAWSSLPGHDGLPADVPRSLGGTPWVPQVEIRFPGL